MPPNYRAPPSNSSGNTGAAVGAGAAIGGLIACVIAVPVVVAIIGILAAIAIPNFLKFQCKSKQSEAKTHLSGIYTSEKAFYGEYNFYTTDLKSLSWQPDGSPLYLYGFAEAGPAVRDLPYGVTPPPDYDPTRKDTSDPLTLGGYYSSARMKDLSGMPLEARDLPADAVVTKDGFVAAAIGDVDTDSYGVKLDVWTIDESRLLSVTENDCAN